MVFSLLIIPQNAILYDIVLLKGEYMKDCCGGHKMMHGGGGAVYGLGFIGAAVYFIQHAANFSEGVFGVLRAIVWPALVIYKVIGLLHI